MEFLMNAYFRPSVVEDTTYLAPLLRTEDKDTIKYMTDMTPLEGLEYSYRCSIETNTIVVNNQVVGMFGVAGSYDEGCPWLLMTDFLSKRPGINKLFLVESRKWIEEKKFEYKKMFNFVSQEHKDHIKWLDWLGFNVMDLYPTFGPYKKPFLYFEMKGNC